MNEMYFKSVLIADIKDRTARFQTFEKGFNVITSQENHLWATNSFISESIFVAMFRPIS